MSDRNYSKGAYAVFAVAVLIVVFRVLSPATTRNEDSTQEPSTPEFGTGREIPDGVLKVPSAMRAMAGMATDHGQWYLPYAVANEEQGIAMLQALRAELLRGNSFPNQLAVPDGLGARGRDMLYPTEPGIARFYITDMNNPAALADFESTVPVVISQPHAGDKSSDVLFLDGHLASVPLGVFPLSEDFLDALEALDPPAHQGKAPGTH